MSDEADTPEADSPNDRTGRRRRADAEGPGAQRATRAPELQSELGRAEAERIALQISARSLSTVRRSVGSPLLFAIVYTSLASAIYFSLGVISGHALGLTPLVFLIAAVLFALTAMTYAEGASLHQERSGSTVFARYAFNELISFVRRLGDPARLHHPDRRHELLGDAVPEGLLEPARTQRRVARPGARVHRDRRARQHPRLRLAALAPRWRCWSSATSRCRG